jgi:hypothetical protein
MASSPQWVLSPDGSQCSAKEFPAPGDRQYVSRNMCEYARYRSDPQTFSHPQGLQCNPWGCQQVWLQPHHSVGGGGMRMQSYQNGPEWRVMGAGWGGGKVAYPGGWKQFW